jgi:hypothetical protein
MYSEVSVIKGRQWKRKNSGRGVLSLSQRMRVSLGENMVFMPGSSSSRRRRRRRRRRKGKLHLGLSYLHNFTCVKHCISMAIILVASLHLLTFLESLQCTTPGWLPDVVCKGFPVGNIIESCLE